MGIRQNGRLVILTPGGEPSHTGAENWGTAPPLAPLPGAYDWRVDSVAGSDTTGDGSADKPWQSFARAVAERARYGDVQGRVTIHLSGIGPYIWTDLRDSHCAGSGARFEIRGDLSQVTTFASGTVAALALPTITVSVPLVAGEHVARFLRVLTGACAGVDIPIAANTISTVTVCQAAPLAEPGKLLAIGDQVAVVLPATELRVPPTGQAAIVGCTGGSAANARAPIVVDGTIPKHVIQWVKLQGVGSSSRLSVSGSNVLLQRVFLSEIALYLYGRAAVQSGGYVGTDPGSYGLSAPNTSPGTRLLYGAGVCQLPHSSSTTAMRVTEDSLFVGSFSTPPTSAGGVIAVWSGIAKIIGCAANQVSASFDGFLHLDVGITQAQSFTTCASVLVNIGARGQIDHRLDISAVDRDAIVVGSGSVLQFVAITLSAKASTAHPTNKFYAAKTLGNGFMRFAGQPVQLLGSTAGEDIALVGSVSSVFASSVLGVNGGMAFTSGQPGLVLRED